MFPGPRECHQPISKRDLQKPRRRTTNEYTARPSCYTQLHQAIVSAPLNPRRLAPVWPIGFIYTWHMFLTKAVAPALPEIIPPLAIPPRDRILAAYVVRAPNRDNGGNTLLTGLGPRVEEQGHSHDRYATIQHPYASLITNFVVQEDRRASAPQPCHSSIRSGLTFSSATGTTPGAESSSRTSAEDPAADQCISRN